jgi:hypothetical protein
MRTDGRNNYVLLCFLFPVRKTFSRKFCTIDLHRHFLTGASTMYLSNCFVFTNLLGTTDAHQSGNAPRHLFPSPFFP